MRLLHVAALPFPTQQGTQAVLHEMLLALSEVLPQTMVSPQMIESLTMAFPPQTIELVQTIELPQVMVLPQVIDWLFMKAYLPVARLRYATGDGAPPFTTSVFLSAA